MGGRIDIILMCVKFGDDPISSLDFSFIGGGVPLRKSWVLGMSDLGPMAAYRLNMARKDF